MNRSILYIFILLIIGGLIRAQNQKPDKKDLQNKIKQKQNEIELTRKYINENKTKQKRTITLLQTINSQISLRQNLIEKTHRHISILEQEIDTLNLEIIQLEEDEGRLKNEYATMIVNAYRNKDKFGQLSYIIGSSSFNQAYKRIKYIKLLSESRARQLVLLKQKQEELNEARLRLMGIKGNKENLVSRKETEKKELITDRKEQAVIYNELKKKEKDLLIELRKQKEAAKKLNKEVERIIAREIEEERRRRDEERRKEAGNTGSKPAESRKEMVRTAEYDQLTADFSGNKNRLPWPVEKGFIIGRFGPHPHPTLKNIQVENNGVDIGTVPGSKVRASFKGTVKAVFNVPGMQKCVMISHGDYFTVYGHLTEVYVKTGDQITTRQTIGDVYTDTEEDRTVVHFEVWRNTQKLNPELWLAD